MLSPLISPAVLTEPPRLPPNTMPGIVNPLLPFKLVQIKRGDKSSTTAKNDISRTIMSFHKSPQDEIGDVIPVDITRRTD